MEWRHTDGSTEWSVDDRTDVGAEAIEAIASVFVPTWTPPVPLSLYPSPARADAGPDQCDVTSPVSLDASQSSIPEGADTYSWRWDRGSAEGETATIDLAPGLHILTLTVAASSGPVHDTVVIRVVEADGTTGEGDRPSRPAETTGCGCEVGPFDTLPTWILATILVLTRRRGEPVVGRARSPTR